MVAVWVKKKKVSSEETLNNLGMPASDNMLGMAVKLMGSDRVLMECPDGYRHLYHIRGKMKRRVWVGQDDVVLTLPWNFQNDKRSNVIWRCTRAQVDILRKKDILTI